MKQQVVYDMRAGIAKRWYFFAGFAFLIFFECRMQTKQIQIWKTEISPEEVSLGNFLFVWFRGFREIKRSSGGNRLIIPTEWLILQLSYFFVMFGYAKKNMQENGYLLFLRLRKRRIWWNAKCIWLAAGTLIYYGIFFLILIIFSAATGTVAMNPTSSIWIGQMNYGCNMECALLTFVLPVLVSFSVGMLMMFLELAISDMVSLMLCFGLEVASAFWNLPFLPGNYSMFYRNQYFTGGTGVSLLSGLVFCALLIASTYLGGNVYVGKYEFLGDHTACM